MGSAQAELDLAGSDVEEDRERTVGGTDFGVAPPAATIAVVRRSIRIQGSDLAVGMPDLPGIGEDTVTARV